MKGAPRMRRIVVAVDFSKGSSLALGRLRTLPRARSIAVHLVHVVAVPTLTPLPVARELAGHELRKLVIHAKRRFARARVTSEISNGRPADEIVRIARTRNAEVIVAGRRGVGGFPRLLLGSTAERLVRLSPIPVLLVSPQSTAYKRVLMPLDVTENVAPVLQAAIRLLPSTATIDLLHAYWAYGEGYLRFGGASKQTIANHRKMVREQAADRLAPIERMLNRARFSTAASLLHGDPRQIIPRVIRARKPDLVVIGNHGRNALSRALIGNAGREVLASTTCDLFLVPIR